MATTLPFTHCHRGSYLQLKLYVPLEKVLQITVSGYVSEVFSRYVEGKILKIIH